MCLLYKVCTCLLATQLSDWLCSKFTSTVCWCSPSPHSTDAQLSQHHKLMSNTTYSVISSRRSLVMWLFCCSRLSSSDESVYLPSAALVEYALLRLLGASSVLQKCSGFSVSAYQYPWLLIRYHYSVVLKGSLAVNSVCRSRELYRGCFRNSFINHTASSLKWIFSVVIFHNSWSVECSFC